VNSDMFRLLGLLCAALALGSCGGGGGNDSSSAPEPPPPSSTLTAGAKLAGFASSIDFYDPGNATKAVVFLHGGGGTNHGIANSLGLNTIAAPPTSGTVNWTWLTTQKIVAVFPQGQGATATWTNRVMTSGQDDVAFLQALAVRIRQLYPSVTGVYLAGHSNGGMMANRMWCESPTTFSAYIAMSGPASQFYNTTPCSPSLAAPYMGIMGGQDSVVLNSPWTGPTWSIAPLFVLAANAAQWVDTTLIAEPVQQQRRITRLCGETLGAAVVSPGAPGRGSINTWTNCSGKLVLRNILQSDHGINELQQTSGAQMIDLIATFISNN
jgi:polyhydroxybutyrate depolymerase